MLVVLDIEHGFCQPCFALANALECGFALKSVSVYICGTSKHNVTGGAYR